MAGASEVGVAYLPIVPTFKGIQAELDKALGPAADAAGRAAGAQAGEGVRGGVTNGLRGAAAEAGRVGEDTGKNMHSGIMSGMGGLASALTRSVAGAGTGVARSFGLAQAFRSETTAVSGHVRDMSSSLVANMRQFRGEAQNAQGGMGAFGRVMTDAWNRGSSAVQAARGHVQNFQAGVRAADGQTGSLSGTMGRLGGVVGSVGGSFTRFRTLASEPISQIRTGIAQAGENMGRFGTSAAVTLGGVATGVAGIALTGGIDRALQIEQAQAKLKGLGNSADDVNLIMQNATASVKGTSFGLNEAATTAANAVAAGIKPGAQLQDVLKTVSNSAAIAGTDMTSMGSIFNKVAANGKLQGDELMQLSDAGVPALSFLAKETGKTSAQVSDMVSKGQIDFNTFANAMKHGVGDAAFEMGKTTSGSFDNLKAALSRLGAGAVQPFLPLVAKMFGGLTAGADAISAKVGPAFKWLADRANQLFGALSQIGDAKVLTQDIVNRMGVSASSPLGRGLVELVGGIRAFAGAWRAANGDVTSTGFPGFMEQCANAIRGFMGWVSQLSGGAIAGMAAVLTPLALNFLKVGKAVEGLSADIGKALGPLAGIVERFLPITGVLGGVASALEFVAGPWGQVISLLIAAYTTSAPVREAFAGLFQALMNLGQVIWTAVAPAFQALAGQGSAISGFFQGLVDKFSALLAVVVPVASTIVNQFAPVIGTVLGGIIRVAVTRFESLIGALQRVVQFVMPIVTSIVSFLAPAITNVTGFIAGMVQALGSGLMPILGTVAGVIGAVAGAFTAYRVAMTVARGVMVLFSGAQAVLNAVMSMNPIMLIVIAIAGLVAALVVAYNRIGWFKDAVNAAWNGIKTVTAVVWNAILAVVRGVVSWFQTSVLPIIRGVINTLGAVFNWFWHSIIQPVWYGIRLTIAVIVAILMTIFQGIVAVVRVTLAPVFTWLWRNVITPVWNGIRSAISAVGNWFVHSLVPFVQGAVRAVGAVFSWLYNNIIRPVWNGIRGFIDSAIHVIVGIFNWIVGIVRNVLGAVFHWLYDHVIKPVWNGIKDFIDRVVRGITIIWNRMMDFIHGPLSDVFHWLYDHVIKPVWDTISAMIKFAWERNIRPTWNAIKGFIEDVLVPAFKWLSDRIKDIWDAITGSIRTAWNWIRDNILTPMMNFLKTTVVDAFNKAKDGIEKAWNKIQDIVKTPVKFVIDTVIKDAFVGNFNKIASKFGIDKIEFTGTQGMKGFSSGGWTGEGDKYDIAGVVHADEFVVSKAARQKFERDNPGVLDAINRTGELPATPPPATRAAKQGEAFTAPPHGPGTEPWGRLQAAASQAGHIYFPKTNFMGIDTESAAKAWMGQSAMDVRMGNGSPGIQGYTTGGNGGWGYFDQSHIWMQGIVPQNRRRGVLIHEMGHALGLAHPAMGDSSTIMDHMMTHKPDWPSGDDYKALRDLWGPPGKGAKKYSYDGKGGDGGGGSGILAALYDHTVGALLDGLIKTIPGSGFPHDLMTGGAKHLAEAIRNWVVGKDGDSGDGGSDSQVASSQSAEKWKPQIQDALKRAGLPTTPAWVDAWVRQVQTESGGNPSAMQGIHDVNSGGNEAAGLVQVIPGTFAAYRDKSLPNNRLDPLANLVAGMNYAKSRYGQNMLSAIGRGHGYAEGGLVKMPKLYDNGGIIPAKSGVQVIDHQRDTPDYVLTDRQWAAAYKGIQLATTQKSGDIHVHYEGPIAEDPTTQGRRLGETLGFYMAKAGV